MADSETSNPQEQEAPERILGRFDSTEDLVKAYQSLEGKFTQVSQEKSAIEQNFTEIASRLDELSAAQAQQPQPYQDQSFVQAQLLEAYENDPLGVMAQIAQASAQQIIAQQTQQLGTQSEQTMGSLADVNLRLASQELQARYPDWTDKVSRVRSVLEENPGLVTDQDMLNVDTLTSKLQLVYDSISYKDLVEGAAQNGVPQANLAELQRTMKLNAQTAPGASGRPDPVTDEKAAWDAIRNAKPTTYYG